MSVFFRIFFASLLILFGFFSLSYLQGRFDHGDERRAFEALQAKFPDLVNDRCRTEMESRWHGVVRIRCAQKSWLVDVVGARIVAEEVEEKTGS